MKKDDHLRMHALLYQVRVYLEDTHAAPEGAFRIYDALGVQPHHVHRDRGSHYRAIGLLGETISKIVSPQRRLYFITQPAHATTPASINALDADAPPTIEERRAEARVDATPTHTNYPPPSEWGTRLIRTELSTP